MLKYFHGHPKLLGLESTILTNNLPDLTVLCLALPFHLWEGSNHTDSSVVDYAKPFQMLFVSSIFFLRHTQKASSMRRSLSLLAVTFWILLINTNLMNEEKGEDTLSMMLSMVREGLERF